MKRTPLLLALCLASLTVIACDRQEPAPPYDPHLDGVSKSPLSNPVNLSLLEDQKALNKSAEPAPAPTPVATPATTTPATAPADASTSTAPAAPLPPPSN